MKREKILAIAILILIFLFHSNEKIHAAELLTNGSFETGTFAGWTVINASGSFVNWANTAAGGSTGFHTSSPQHGIRSAWNGVAANGGVPFLLYQDVTIPAASTASLQWRHRFQLDHASFCGGANPPCGTAQFAVEILNTSNSLLQTLYVFNVGPSQIVDTGWFIGSVNLNAYAGQTIRIRFRNVTSNTFVGPGMAEIDGVSVQTPAIVPTAAEVTVGGRITNGDKVGLSRVPVTLTDANGNTRITYSNSFGYYQFEEVQAGETYIITVNHHKYAFNDNPRVVQIEDNIATIDFNASP